MPIALVQAYRTQISGAASSTTTIDNVVAGNKIIVFTSCFQFNPSAASVPTLSSFPGVPWVNNANGGPISQAGSVFVTQGSILSADTTVGGSHILFFELGGEPYANVVVAEFSGVGAGDQSAARANSSTTPVVGPTPVTSVPNELVVALYAASGGTADPIGLDLPSGYTNIGINQISNNYNAISVDYKVISARGAQSCSWGTITPPSDLISSMAIATFRSLDPGAADPPSSTLIQPKVFWLT